MRDRREQLGLKQSELGKLLGVTGSAIGNYENGVSAPKSDILYKIFDILQCDANYLFQDEISDKYRNFQNMSSETAELLEMFRRLDSYGQAAVRAVIREEMTRIREEQKFPVLTGDNSAVRTVPLLSGRLYRTPESSGEFERAWEEYRVPEGIEADFVVRVSGDSMEPYLPNASIAYGLQKKPQIGEIAFIMVDGVNYIRQFCQDNYGNLYLYTLNRKRKNLDLLIRAGDERKVKIWGVIQMKERFPLPMD